MSWFLPAGPGLGGTGGVEPPGPGAGSCLGPLPRRGPQAPSLAICPSGVSCPWLESQGHRCQFIKREASFPAIPDCTKAKKHGAAIIFAALQLPGIRAYNRKITISPKFSAGLEARLMSHSPAGTGTPGHLTPEWQRFSTGTSSFVPVPRCGGGGTFHPKAK